MNVHAGYARERARTLHARSTRHASTALPVRLRRPLDQGLDPFCVLHPCDRKQRPSASVSVRQRPSASASVSERKAEKTQAKQRRRHSGRKKKRSCCALTEVVIALAVLNNLSSRGVAIDRPELGPADQRELSGVRDMVRDISSGPSVPRHGTHWTSAAAQEMTETIRVTIPSMTPQRHE